MREIWRQQLFKGVYGGYPLFSGVPIRVQREGKNSKYERTSGERKAIEYKKVSVEMLFKPEEGEGKGSHFFADVSCLSTSDKCWPIQIH